MAPPGLQHGLDLELHAQKHPLEIDAQDAVEIRFTLSCQRGGGRQDSGIIERRIDLAEALHRKGDQRLDGGRIGNIGFNERSDTALFFYRLDGVGGASIDITDHHIGTIAGEGQCSGTANAGGRACDQYGLADKVERMGRHSGSLV